MNFKPYSLILALAMLFSPALTAQENFEEMDVFELEYAADPQISPDGSSVIYVRNFKDVMADANRSNLWMVDIANGQHTPFTTGQNNDRSPIWSPDGKRVVYVTNRDQSSQIYQRWLVNGAEARLTNLAQSPGSLTFSPDGKWIAFTMAVSYEHATLGTAAKKPTDAVWADLPIFIDKLTYRADGAGYLKPTHTQIFVLSTDGGTARQITKDPWNHGGNLSWSPDSKAIYFSANGHEDREYEPLNSEVYRVNVLNGEATQLTDRKGPDTNPEISPDGKYLAYTGFDDKYLGYQTPKLYLRDLSSGQTKCLTEKLDRQIGNVQWSEDGSHIYFQYDEKGMGKVARTNLTGNIEMLVDNMGGMSLGRPYTAGTYDVGKGGAIVYTVSRSDRPADLAIRSNGKKKMLTALNDDLFDHKKLGTVEEITWKSSFDDQEIQGWICKPSDFDPNKKYPLLLEIHGGPFANYGPHFSAELQLYAAKGYVVLYCNPRGSSSYGHNFGNLIHHNYPGEDYDDLMSGVDAVIDKGYIDKDQLYVTGGSGGGVLSSWIVGKTDRFRAAVVVKPVINWYSFVLHADNPAFFYKYWFPGLPWEHERHYMKRSPISLVGNVTTPTMLLTGEKDYRTPISETEQYYAALKLNKVESAMVRMPGAGHGIANKPSQLIAKVNSITAWFEKYRVPKT